MPTDPRISVHLDADVTRAAEGFIEAFLHTLTGVDREFLCGAEDPAGIARQWAAAGPAVADIQAWGLDARCFDPGAARQLADAGITPQRASVRIHVETGGYQDTIGYAFANGDVTLDEALAAAGGAQ